LARRIPHPDTAQARALPGAGRLAAHPASEQADKPTRAAAMYLMYYLDGEGNRVYTLQVRARRDPLGAGWSGGRLSGFPPSPAAAARQGPSGLA
jgi:hypothetical protein